jgi:hypothetical protein
MKPTRWVKRGSAGALDQQSRRGRDRSDERDRIKSVGLEQRLARLRHHESGEAIRHRLGSEHDHTVGRTHGELGRQRHDRKPGDRGGDFRRSAAITERDVGTIGEENPLQRALAGNQRRGPGAAAVKLKRLGFERRAGAGARRFGAAEHRPSVVAGGVRARRRGGEPHGRIEQTLEHVRRREADRAPRDGAEPVAGEIDDEALRMADREALGLAHIGGGEKIDVGPGLDLLAHQARRTEFGRGDGVGSGRESAQQIAKGRGKAAGACNVQRFGRCDGRGEKQGDQAQGEAV